MQCIWLVLNYGPFDPKSNTLLTEQLGSGPCAINEICPFISADVWNNSVSSPDNYYASSFDADET